MIGEPIGPDHERTRRRSIALLFLILVASNAFWLGAANRAHTDALLLEQQRDIALSATFDAARKLEQCEAGRRTIVAQAQ